MFLPMPLAGAWVNRWTFSHFLFSSHLQIFVPTRPRKAQVFVSLRYIKCHGGHGSLAVCAILFTLPLGCMSNFPLGCMSNLLLGYKSNLPLGCKSNLPLVFISKLLFGCKSKLLFGCKSKLLYGCISKLLFGCKFKLQLGCKSKLRYKFKIIPSTLQAQRALQVDKGHQLVAEGH